MNNSLPLRPHIFLAVEACLAEQGWSGLPEAFWALSDLSFLTCRMEPGWVITRAPWEDQARSWVSEPSGSPGPPLGRGSGSPCLAERVGWVKTTPLSVLCMHQENSQPPLKWECRQF